MSDAHYLAALERTIAQLIREFTAAPDLALREADLHAAFCRHLQEQELLAAPTLTRDGRITGLVHSEYPVLLAYEGVLPRPCYDVVLLNPRFVRSYPLEVVANSTPRAAQTLRALPPEERPLPLLAAVNLKLLEDLTPALLEELETDFYDLVRAEPDATRSYMIILCRHWDLEGPLQHAAEMLQTWAAHQPHVSAVLVQAFYDEMGHTSGGRYFNLWTHTAPLLPLGLPTTASFRRPLR
jgi:hypothetical protein